jgi:hypothetical protein
VCAQALQFAHMGAEHDVAEGDGGGPAAPGWRAARGNLDHAIDEARALAERQQAGPARGRSAYWAGPRGAGAGQAIYTKLGVSFASYSAPSTGSMSASGKSHLAAQVQGGQHIL